MTDACTIDRKECYVALAGVWRDQLSALSTVELFKLLTKLSDTHDRTLFLEFMSSGDIVGSGKDGEVIWEFVLSAAELVVMTELELRRGVRPTETVVQ